MTVASHPASQPRPGTRPPRGRREGRPVDGLGLPRVDRGGLRDGGAARLRRRRGDGRHRRDQPGPRPGRPPRRLPPDPGLRGARTLPAADPAGLGPRPLGQARDQHRDGPAGGGRAWSWCTRRSGGSATTPAASSRVWRCWRSGPASTSRWRTCTRGGRVAARPRSTPPTGTSPDRRTPGPAHHARRLPRRHRPAGLPGARPDARRPAQPHPPHRRLGQRQGRAPRARAGQPARRGDARARRRHGLRRLRGARDQHPQVRGPAPARDRPDRGPGLRPAPPRPASGEAEVALPAAEGQRP